MEQLFELMSALEGLSGQLAAERRSEAELAGIRALHADMLAAHARHDLPVYYDLNRRIHQAFNRCARNAMLTETYESVNTRIQNLRFRSNFNEDKWENAVREHQAMLDALEAGNGAVLRAVLEKHLHNKRDAVLEQWSEIGRQQREAVAEAPARSPPGNVDERAVGGVPR
ncbi:MAG: GntR family transcriptional regulator [Gammaproteobacteria bacterium]